MSEAVMPGDDSAGAGNARSLPAPASFGAWILAARPTTLVAGWAPVLAGTALAGLYGSVVPLRAAAALVVAVAIQIGTNFVNDAADHARGADTADRLGPPRAVAVGLLPGRTVMRVGLACFALAGACGVWLASVSGWWLLLPGGVALLAGIAYTAGPAPLAYLGLGEIFVFAFFGVFAAAGTAYVQLAGSLLAGRGTLVAAWAGVSLGLVAVAVLEVNNLRDIPTDVRAGKRTLAVRLGAPVARAAIVGLLVASFIPPLGYAVSEAPTFFAVLVAVPFMVPVIAAIRRRTEGRALNPVLGHVARFEMALTAGIVMGALTSTVGARIS